MYGNSEYINNYQPAPSSSGERRRNPTVAFTGFQPRTSSSVSHEPKPEHEGSQYGGSRCDSPGPIDGSALRSVPLPGGLRGEEGDTGSTYEIHEQPPTPFDGRSLRSEENIYGGARVAGSSNGGSGSRPLRLRLPGHEEPTYNPPGTTITIRVEQPSPSTPTRNSPRHDEPIQTIPHVVNVSESTHSPVHLVTGRREEPTHSAHPGTTITIRVDQPVSPSLHDRSPGHEGPMVGGPSPIGNSVGETAREPRARPRPVRRRPTRHVELNPNPTNLPMTRSVSESQTARPVPRRRFATDEGLMINPPPVARRIASESHYRTPSRRTSRHARPTPKAAPLTTYRDRSASLPGTSLSPPPLDQRPPVLGVPGLTYSPLPAGTDGVSLASFRSPVPEVLHPPVGPDWPMPGVSTSEVRPVFDQTLFPDPDPHHYHHPLKTGPSISATNDSLTPVKVTPLAKRIPYIFPVVSLLEVLPKQNVVTQHQEEWDVVNDKLGKVTQLVGNVVTTCANNNLEENDLPRNLHTIFQSLESQLGPIKHTMKQSENVGVIKRVFSGTNSQRKVKAYDTKLSDVLQAFQAALAFNPHFAEFAAQIEVKVTDLNARFDEDQTPLHVASQLGHVRVIRSLISRGANLNAENEVKETPLFLVSRNGYEQATELLLQSSARVNHQDREKRTPLHRASENGHDSVTNLLLKYRADSNAKNVYDWTPLHLASRTGKTTVVRILLRWRANIDAPNDFGWTPLHMAAQKGHWEVADLLLFKGAMVDTPEARGETALHLAAYYGHTAIVSRLIDYGADVRIRNKERKTALDLARMEGHVDVIRLLEARR